MEVDVAIKYSLRQYHKYLQLLRNLQDNFVNRNMESGKYIFMYSYCMFHDISRLFSSFYPPYLIVFETYSL